MFVPASIVFITVCIVRKCLLDYFGIKVINQKLLKTNDRLNDQSNDQNQNKKTINDQPKVLSVSDNSMINPNEPKYCSITEQSKYNTSGSPSDGLLTLPDVLKLVVL